jgi:hypothetical protein
MKLLFKLLIVALIANASWQVGSAYLNYYRFKDAVRQTTQFRGKLTDDQVHKRLLELANEYSVPVTDDTLTMTVRENHTIVEGSYVQPIDIVPTYRYDWPFKFYVDTFITDPENILPR